MIWERVILLYWDYSFLDFDQHLNDKKYKNARLVGTLMENQPL